LTAAQRPFYQHTVQVLALGQSTGPQRATAARPQRWVGPTAYSHAQVIHPRPDLEPNDWVRAAAAARL
jgi:hypothetical protein